jgi:L-seryl-tRNA(Ser) seleniumtransferase
LSDTDRTDGADRAPATRRRRAADPTVRPPSVERLLAIVRRRLAGRRNGDALTAAARDLIDEERRRLASGAEAATLDALADGLVERFEGWAGNGADLRAINATGVIVHTNLGRAVWPDVAIRAAEAAARDSVLLEIDRASGRRGARFRLAEEHLIALTGGEDALVTNNNAAALALAVALSGRGHGVVVSRGELIEIGGGVRIPEIVRRAGAKLIEVGTTNRTRVADFEAPLAAGVATIVLRVHPSNFRQEGFVEGPDPAGLAALAHRHGAIVVDDLGSGALLSTERFGLAHEPTPRERLAAGADVVTFSGDKLVGGPQAGLVVGRADLVGRMRRDPLARAMRPDKMTLAGVAATLGLYRAGLAETAIPVWLAIGRPVADLRARAKSIAAVLGTHASVVDVRSTVGGGSLPGETLPSVAVAVRSGSPDRLLAALRRGSPAVIGRIEDDLAVFDLRTVEPGADDELRAALVAALGSAVGRSAVGRSAASGSD